MLRAEHLRLRLAARLLGFSLSLRTRLGHALGHRPVELRLTSTLRRTPTLRRTRNFCPTCRKVPRRPPPRRGAAVVGGRTDETAARPAVVRRLAPHSRCRARTAGGTTPLATSRCLSSRHPRQRHHRRQRPEAGAGTRDGALEQPPAGLHAQQRRGGPGQKAAALSLQRDVLPVQVPQFGRRRLERLREGVLHQRRILGVEAVRLRLDGAVHPRLAQDDLLRKRRAAPGRPWRLRRLWLLRGCGSRVPGWHVARGSC
mmetsp:Transcript_4258/g.14026  ORF Transcript_4258/g.14026 Transcript_4258/m.14026 type:complete len:257 (+) Transcript_4258:2-772(+)